jgi:hypothetical protein
MSEWLFHLVIRAAAQGWRLGSLVFETFLKPQRKKKDED